MLASCSRSHVLLSCSLAIVTSIARFPTQTDTVYDTCPQDALPQVPSHLAQAASPPRGCASRAARVCRERDTRVRVTVSVSRIPHTRVYAEWRTRRACFSISPHPAHAQSAALYPFTTITISERPGHPHAHMAALRILARGPAGSDSRRSLARESQRIGTRASAASPRRASAASPRRATGDASSARRTAEDVPPTCSGRRVSKHGRQRRTAAAARPGHPRALLGRRHTNLPACTRPCGRGEALSWSRGICARPCRVARGKPASGLSGAPSLEPRQRGWYAH